MKILIKNGICIDGNGNPPVRTDVLLCGDTIEAIGNGIKADAEVIDAAGMYITPGFIDIHRHADSRPIVDGRFGEIENLQGITTVVSGNCGLASVPINPNGSNMQDMVDFLQPCLGILGRNAVFNDYKEYREAISRSVLSVNFGFLVGTGAVKAAIKGFSRSAFSKEEMRLAQALINSGFDNGALGTSSGIMYPPECYSSRDEFIQLLAPVSDRDGLLCCHIRGEGDSLLQSVEEVIDIASKAGCRLNISHFKATGRRNWSSLIHQAAELIGNAREGGLDVSCDFYPYDCGSSTIQSLIPPSCMKSSIIETAAYLSTKTGIEHLRSVIDKKDNAWDNMVESIGWDRIIIGSVDNDDQRLLEGLDFHIAAKSCGMDEVMLLCRLFSENNGKVGVIVRSMDSHDVDFVASLPYSSLISDALYGSARFPHPRLYGAFPRFLREYVVEKKILPIERAIYKMTGLPASKIRIKDRGILKPGKKADINIFSLGKFVDKATYSKPTELAEGLSYSFINGKMTVKDGVWLGKDAGTFINI